DNKIEELGYSWKPKILTDFESGLIAAIDEFFQHRGTLHKGCYFHYAQALRKAFAKCSLDKQEYYQTNIHHHRFYLAWKSLAFVPPFALESAVEEIKFKYLPTIKGEEAENSWKAFIDYYETSWVDRKKVRFMFTYFIEDLDRTNNSTEKWNLSF
ncbi:MAG TPA: hypothetical protein PLS50_09060, partial [Candidatus Dojkabacteria bacterium]|nr:hypothetical protein [Candidatus Dojkabacteria bacterium]